MDVTDVRILRELGFIAFQHGARGPDALRPSVVAAKLSLSADLVKERIAKLEALGVLNGSEAFPNLRHLGLAQTTLHYDVDGRAKARVVERLRDVEGISGVFEFVGPGICVDVYHRDTAELQRRMRLIASLAEVPEPRRYYEYPYPPVAGDLTPLDWRVLAALRADARRSPAEVAEEVGVSAKTVGRRIDRMVAQGSMDVLPRVDPSQFRDIIPFNLACYFEPNAAPTAMPAIEAALGERFFFSWVPPAVELGNYDVFAFVQKPREMEALRMRVAALPGVARAEVLLPCNAAFASDWLTRAIRERVSEPPAATP